VAETRAGGFATPAATGWSAERVVAHLAVNDGLLAAVTEQLRELRGEGGSEQGELGG
jgi:hypothetical protein